MKNYSIVCICQIYNELCKGNLERFVNYVLPLVSHLVVYADGSTDGSYEYMLKNTPYVLRGTKNDFVNERSHKQLLLQEALKLKPDFILWLDADEVLTANAAEKLQELCALCDEKQKDAVNMHEVNLWRSCAWQRLDSLYDSGWFCRLWLDDDEPKPLSFAKSLAYVEEYREEVFEIISGGVDFEGALQELPKRTFAPRQVMLEKNFSTQDSMQMWQRLLTAVFKELMIAKANDQREVERPKVSIIITTFQRTHLLRWGLYSLALQTMPFEFETIVVNDGLLDETEEICNEFKEKLNLKYIFTGQRNLKGGSVWRVPGFAINIGVKQSTGDILVMCCAEMFHINDTIVRLTKPILDNPKLLGIPLGKDDRNGALLECINKNNGTFDLATYNKCVDLTTTMPFLMALHRSQFIEIGGYDEDFVGIAYDDRDLIDRLLGNGCHYCPTDATTVHLYHPRAKGYYEGEGPPEWDYNKNLYFSRMGKIVRNEGRAWGILR